jgi:hypothetical protein
MNNTAKVASVGSLYNIVVISLNNINWMVFEMDKEFVLSVAETAFSYIISINVSLQWVTHVDCGPLR